MCKTILTFIFSTISLFAQIQTDSLLQCISDFPDTTQIRILNESVWKLRSKAPIAALELGNKAIEIETRIDNKALLATTHNFLGVVYRNIGDYETSLRHYVNALNIAENIKDSVQIAYSFNNIGGIHRLQGNYTLALENILRALNYFEKLGNNEGAAYCTINIGILYRYQKNHAKALEYFQRTVDIREKIGDLFGKALALNQFAEVYYEQKKWPEALKYYRLLESAYKELDDTKGIATVLGGIGGIYYHSGEYDKALDYRLRALKINKDIGNIEGQIVNLTNLGLIYARKSQFSLGQKYLNKALELSNNLNSLGMKLECYNVLKEYYTLRGNYKSALNYLQLYSDLKDSVITQTNIAQIAEMEAVYRTEKSEREKQILLKDVELKTKQQTYMLIIVILILILGIFIYSRYRAKKAANKKLQELNAMKDKFFGIVAHDLKNPLNTILGYSEYLFTSYEDFNDEERKEEIQQIYNASKKVTSLIGNLLEWSRSQSERINIRQTKINIAELIDNNVSLFEPNAKAKTIRLRIECSPKLIISSDEDILNTILRNLLSNALKFTDTGGSIEIKCYSNNGKVSIAVKDTGVGIPTEHIDLLFRIDKDFTTVGTHKEKGTGLGLILIKELVEKLDGSIDVKSELGIGSTFTIIIPN